ncbi:uncharacterized protein ColSpa_06572 [Colletotrichum spaethianum]|uniref:Uncharacterized protein n=1 Tax=Colletotrichum spaethianum TaxID=700344 RepID=A0AA37LD16_9PEZI|nr:uncharacterized protein ColSpa_06572 [Colletotrichum spaethianum]GKT46391.1 hypothetical protein ColSpa_06572 [Colletotrichum spaethianum]
MEQSHRGSRILGNIEDGVKHVEPVFNAVARNVQELRYSTGREGAREYDDGANNMAELLENFLSF